MTLHPNPKSSIFVHLPILDLLIIDHNLKKILEIGVNEGNTTLQILKSLSKTGGELISIDIAYLQEHLEKIKNPNFNFIWKDSLKLDTSHVTEIDLLLIDSKHTKKQLEQELQKYSPLVKKNGYICLHDINEDSNSEMFPAFKQFINKTNYPYFWIEYQKGFVVIKKID